MKKTTLILLITLLTLSSCGKKGGSEVAIVEEPTPTSTPQEESGIDTQILAIDAICNEDNDISYYTSLISGDILYKEEENTTISIFHNHENKKVACVEWGEALILRSI